MQQINLNNNDKKDKLDAETIKQLVLVDYKRITVMVGLALILVIAFFFTSSMFSDSETDALKKYNKYQSDLLASQSATENNDVTYKTVIIPSDTAVDADKINNDIANAESYIRTWFNWTNGDEYDVARADVLSVFGENSIMAEMFVENARLESGNNYVDRFEINMSVNDIKTYPIEINKDGDNRYLSVISSSTNTANGTTSYSIMMTYTFDSNSTMTDARVYLNNN